jgi:hypothetical protein
MFLRVEECIAKMSDGTDEREALELLVKRKGGMPYEDFLTKIGYLSKGDRTAATRLFGSLKKRVNAKLGDRGWLFYREGNDVVLKRQKTRQK